MAPATSREFNRRGWASASERLEPGSSARALVAVDRYYAWFDSWNERTEALLAARRAERYAKCPMAKERCATCRGSGVIEVERPR